ncbi:MAG: hypothetical protein KF850_04440 [Labilithrix sp.]|nr:hypothetical protein [Labilithrix sp.]
MVAASLVGLSALLACSESPSDAPRREEGEVAALGMALYGDFGDASVRVTGARTPSANGAYFCESAVVTCLNFGSDGGTGIIPGLCPSTNVPSGTWNFSYELFKGTNCPGSPITGVVCPATTGQVLPAGTVTTVQVTCS